MEARDDAAREADDMATDPLMGLVADLARIAAEMYLRGKLDDHPNQPHEPSPSSGKSAKEAIDEA